MLSAQNKQNILGYADRLRSQVVNLQPDFSEILSSLEIQLTLHPKTKKHNGYT
jgi:hypothetical protein